MQVTRFITHTLYLISFAFSGGSVIMSLALDGGHSVLTPTLITFFLGLLGALINFNSPSYKSEEELTKLKEEYQEEIKRLTEIRIKLVKHIEDSLN
jgi:hypothetical protein